MQFISKKIPTTFATSFKLLFKKQKEIPLGRWKVDHKNQFLKAEYANRDSCGDDLCCEPIKYKDVIKK